MKVVIRDILSFQEKDFFSAIRDKVDYARLIIYAARVVLLNIPSETQPANSSLKLIVGDMSRLFIYKNGKIFSVSFPFNITLNGNEVTEISTYSGKNVDNQIISTLVSILNDEQFKLMPSPMDFWVESERGASSEGLLEGLSLLEEIFLFEPAYIRYDCDAKNENGRLHPLHHLDINYSSYGTYKLGLNKGVIDSSFENILNTQTDCSFISDK